MTWNYRIVRYRDGSGFGLHEVYYGDDGVAYTMTQAPATFACHVDEGPEGVRESIIIANVDAKRRPVFDEPDVWPDKLT